MKFSTVIASAMMILTPLVAGAQNTTNVSVPEPEFVNSYYMLTSDSTYAELPKENGSVKKHVSLGARIGKIASHVADVGAAAGGIGVYTSNSIGGVVDGIKVMGTAANVGDAANAITNLAFAEGQDIVFGNTHSPYVVSQKGTPIRIVINNGSNSVDPRDMFRVVRFNTSKKDRKIRWQTITPSLFGTTKAEEIGYVNFSGHRYGNQSYVITIPANENKAGEYGIFYMTLASATDIPIATFSIQ